MSDGPAVRALRAALVEGCTLAEARRISPLAWVEFQRLGKVGALEPADDDGRMKLRQVARQAPAPRPAVRSDFAERWQAAEQAREAEREQKRQRARQVEQAAKLPPAERKKFLADAAMLDRARAAIREIRKRPRTDTAALAATFGIDIDDNPQEI